MSLLFMYSKKLINHEIKKGYLLVSCTNQALHFPESCIEERMKRFGERMIGKEYYDYGVINLGEKIKIGSIFTSLVLQDNNKPYSFELSYEKTMQEIFPELNPDEIISIEYKK